MLSKRKEDLRDDSEVKMALHHGDRHNPSFTSDTCTEAIDRQEGFLTVSKSKTRRFRLTERHSLKGTEKSNRGGNPMTSSGLCAWLCTGTCEHTQTHTQIHIERKKPYNF